ncbi:hypothetical protein CgunFtcFv8_017597 [Champsocephalus gunnari]|uniref:Uncharacterized protein n=1 Tax=Champsocephalus gunnari TaxID=52237 RepID=A0AAN8DN28_CHAGU|nr:hypothetical protein CgunFtcFv8_017597 [Champsocephalus gunnari]
MFLTLTSCVYQPLPDIKDRANSLLSQVSKKINHAPWEPLFLVESSNEAARPASSCLSAGMTSARALDTGRTAEKTCQCPGASLLRRSGVVLSESLEL